MQYKYQYQNLEERNSLLDEHKDKILIEEQNLIDGNFLIFSDTPIEKEVIYVNVPQSDLNDIKNSIVEAQNAINSLLGV